MDAYYKIREALEQLWQAAAAHSDTLFDLCTRAKKVLSETSLPNGECPNCGAGPDRRDVLCDEEYLDYETTIRNMTCEACGAQIKETYTLTEIEALAEGEV